MRDTINELRHLVLKHAAGRSRETAIPRVTLFQGEATARPMPGFYEPAICLILQGARCMLIGDQAIHCDQASYFISTIDVPMTNEIYSAGPERPYLSIVLKFDPAVISDVLLSMEDDAPLATPAPTSGFGISPVTPDLLDAWLRLLQLVEAPRDIPVLAPLIEREIMYRLLKGPHGAMLRQAATGDSRLAQVRRAIGWIRDNLAEPFQIEDLAARAGMSASTFHRHFKTVTAMSPIQYQKRLRLHVARRMMISEAGDVAHIAFSVGYESATQFSREYARLFGAPPARDGARLKKLDQDGWAPLPTMA